MAGAGAAAAASSSEPGLTLATILGLTRIPPTEPDHAAAAADDDDDPTQYRWKMADGIDYVYKPNGDTFVPASLSRLYDELKEKYSQSLPPFPDTSTDAAPLLRWNQTLSVLYFVSSILETKDSDLSSQHLVTWMRTAEQINIHCQFDLNWLIERLSTFSLPSVEERVQSLSLRDEANNNHVMHFTHKSVLEGLISTTGLF